jgi:hypothetical protein
MHNGKTSPIRELGKDLLDDLCKPRGKNAANPTPLQKWEGENLRWTFPMFLIYAAPVILHLFFDYWLIMSAASMALGIWFIRGEGRKLMGIALLVMLLYLNLSKSDTNVGLAVYCLLCWGVFGYITAYCNGQDAKRDAKRRDWEDK